MGEGFSFLLFFFFVALSTHWRLICASSLACDDQPLLRVSLRLSLSLCVRLSLSLLRVSARRYRGSSFRLLRPSLVSCACRSLPNGEDLRPRGALPDLISCL